MPGPAPTRIFALERLRDAAGELDHLEPALDVALGVGDDLAVLGRQDLRELIHVALDQFLELEHDAGAALRVGRGPFRLGGAGGVHRALEVGGAAEADAGLDLALVGVEHVARTLSGRIAFAGDEMVDVTQHVEASWSGRDRGSPRPASSNASWTAVIQRYSAMASKCPSRYQIVKNGIAAGWPSRRRAVRADVPECHSKVASTRPPRHCPRSSSAGTIAPGLLLEILSRLRLSPIATPDGPSQVDRVRTPVFSEKLAPSPDLLRPVRKSLLRRYQRCAVSGGRGCAGLDHLRRDCRRLGGSFRLRWGCAAPASALQRASQHRLHPISEVAAMPPRWVAAVDIEIAKGKALLAIG